MEIGRNPISKHHIQSEYVEMSRLTRDGTAEHVSRVQILRREQGQGNIYFIYFRCSVDHEQDWHTYPVDLYSCHKCVMTIHMSYIQDDEKRFL